MNSPHRIRRSKKQKFSEAPQTQTPATHNPSNTLNLTRNSDIVQLQSTVGNQVVQRLLTKKKKSPAPIKQASAGIMSFADFRRATGQSHKRSAAEVVFHHRKGKEGEQDREAILSGRKGTDELVEQRTANGLESKTLTDWFGDSQAKSYRTQVDINGAYKRYEADPSIATLVDLYDTITYWKTMFAGMSWVSEVIGVLNLVMAQIKAQVKKETQQMAGGDGDDDSILSDNAQSSAAPMPSFLEEIGVPQAYYDQHLAPNQDYVKALQAFYDNLKDGHHFAAAQAWKVIQHVDGINFIKSLFMSHFPQQANLKRIVGTDAGSGGEITPEEKAAILLYSGGSYDVMNSQLRDQGTQQQAMRIGVKDADRRDAYDHRFSLQSSMRLAVSGLNKLPKYQGISYRILFKMPANYMDLIHPGAVTSDVGFVSSSPSITGVKNYAKTTTGDKSTYFVIHTKTAVNIVSLSGIPNEAEVLFRPGTRFQINNVWQKKNGKVPTAAPAEVQMILHTIQTDSWHDAKAFPMRVIEMSEM